MWPALTLPIAYLLGFWCCYILRPPLSGGDPLQARAVLSAVLGQTNSCRSPAKPAGCDCDARAGPATLSLDLHRQALRRQALPCVDPHAALRRAPGRPTAVLAACALDWLTNHSATELDPSRPQIVFDFAYNGLAHPLPPVTAAQWVFLTALLPEPDLPLPARRPLPINQLLLAPPSAYRLRALFTTNSLFDVQLALRFDDVLAAVAPVPAVEALAGLLGMARRTYLLLSCNATWGVTDAEFVKQAVRSRLARVLEMGLHQLDIQVSVAAVFQHGECVKELLRVEPLKIHRGVRLKWCYYPLGTKYDLIYRRNDMVQLVHRYILQWTRFGGDKVKTIRKWYPSINMGDVLGWGLGRQQREVLFWDMLTQPSCPDPAIQNWLLTRGGRVLRIDPNQQSWKNKHPVARQYVEFLRIFLCVSRGTGWRQKFDKQVSAACMSCSGGSLIHISGDLKYKFFVNILHQRAEGSDSYIPVDLGDAVANNEYPECPPCNQCVMHTWRSLKLFWHNNKSLPPYACTACYHCQRAQVTAGGIALNATALHGCTDVEGVGDDGVDNPDYCYDTQPKPIPRPSAPLEAIKKGPY